MTKFREGDRQGEMLAYSAGNRVGKWIWQNICPVSTQARQEATCLNLADFMKITINAG